MLRVSNFSGELLQVYLGGRAPAGVRRRRRQAGRPVACASLHGDAFYPRAGLELQGSAVAGIRYNSARGSMLDADGPGRCEVVSAEYLGFAEL